MSNEIIGIYLIIMNDFHHINIIYSFYKISFHYFKNYLMMKLTLFKGKVFHLGIKKPLNQKTYC
jgi:hypothetical protein